MYIYIYIYIYIDMSDQKLSFQFSGGVQFTSGNSFRNLLVLSSFSCLASLGSGAGNGCPKYVHRNGGRNGWNIAQQKYRPWPFGHERESSFWSTSGLLPGNSSNTQTLVHMVPLDAGSHIFYLFMVFHLHSNDFSFFFPMYFQ